MRVRKATRGSDPASGTPIAETKTKDLPPIRWVHVGRLPMTLARSILMNALTRPVTRNAERTSINVAVAAIFADPNCIVVACKRQRVITRCYTSAQSVGFNERSILDRRNSTIPALTTFEWHGFGFS